MGKLTYSAAGFTSQEVGSATGSLQYFRTIVLRAEEENNYACHSNSSHLVRIFILCGVAYSEEHYPYLGLPFQQSLDESGKVTKSG